MDIFIVESLKGTHVHAIKKIAPDAIILAFTFRHSFVSLSNKIKDIPIDTKITVRNRKMFQSSLGEKEKDILIESMNGDIVAFIDYITQKHNIVNIFLAYDNDFTGEYMASVLQQHLLSLAQKTNIERLPLIEDGYNFVNVGFQDFLPADTLLEILEKDKNEQHYMNSGHNRSRMGFRKLFSLKHLVKRMAEKNPIVQRLSRGTSTATYYTKGLLNEKGSTVD